MRTIALYLLYLLPLLSFAQTKIRAGWGDKNFQYEEGVTPDLVWRNNTRVNAWRGERLGLLAVLSSETPVTCSLRPSDPFGNGGQRADSPQASFIGYVITDNFKACGNHPSNLAPYTVPDMLTRDRYHRVKEVAPVWLTIEVPREAEPGLYKGLLEVVDSLSGRVIARLNYQVNVLNLTLPTPEAQHFHTDFWQQPYAVARMHGVERWSDAHFELLRPYLRLLARSGQRVCSTILFYEPWGDQSYDKFDPMIRTTLRTDGQWAYDYSVFDRWVALCEECGIRGEINCFSMVPWDMSFRYFDEAKGHDVELKTTTSSPEYKALWTDFLKHFSVHLREKGWFDKTCIAMDERGLGNMLDAYRVAQEAVPGIKMALAGNYHKELVGLLHDYCIAYGQNFSPEELAARRAKGQISTTYTCCSTPAPNIFSNSLPAEATYLPLYCIANGYDGYLHWSWMNWADQPTKDSRFRLFAPGDTYLVYPGPASSVRYERYIEGIALAEKLRILRETHQKAGHAKIVERLDQALQTFKQDRPERPCSELIKSLEKVLEEASI